MSCICLTYGRPELLEEAVHSFLVQEYAGPKELIVLNDHVEQRLAFEQPEVRVINLPRRFRTVGEKCNAAVALASHDLLFVWDDDDVYLPHRLAFSVERFDAGKGFFKPARAWMLSNGELTGPHENVFHVGACFSRELFDAVRGYPAMGNGYDQEIEARMEEARAGSTATYDIRPEEIYYVYRWGGTGSFHMSAMGEEDVDRFVDARLRRGEVELVPRWRTDYARLVADHLAAESVS